MKKRAFAFGMMTILAISSAAFAGGKTILTCDSAGDVAGLEDLSVSTTDKAGIYTLSITVSGPGDFFETYHYAVQEDARDPGFNESFGYVSVKAGRATLSLDHFSAQKSKGKISAIGPKSSPTEFE